MAAWQKMIAFLVAMIMMAGILPAVAEEVENADAQVQEEMSAEPEVQDEAEPDNSVQAQPAYNTGLLALATSAAPLTSTYEPEDLVKLVSRRNDVKGNNENNGVYTVSSSSIQLRKEAAEALVRLCNDAEEAKLTLYVRQGYRSYADEASRYARLEKRGEISQKPGENDYQTGLAVTLVSKAWRAKTLTTAFGDTKEAQWIAANCARYGFVLRYPQGKQEATGWEWEPWHLRYVGEEVAQVMQLNNQCLEEFLQDNGLDGVIDMPPEATPGPETGKTKRTSTKSAPVQEKPVYNVPEYLPDGDRILDEMGPDGDYEISLFHD